MFQIKVKYMIMNLIRIQSLNRTPYLNVVLRIKANPVLNRAICVNNSWRTVIKNLSVKDLQINNLCIKFFKHGQLKQYRTYAIYNSAEISIEKMNTSKV